MKQVIKQHKDNMVFFWGGIYSQWHRVKFTVGGVTYNCAEQFMMHQKAVMFGDVANASRIMAEKDPRKQKALGRKVEGFIKDQWDKAAISIVTQGNIAKFEQNPSLLKQLLATEDKLIVEASPKDDIWGIGLDEYDALRTPQSEWKGTNWLGISLMAARTHLRDKQA